ncbi:MAG: SH3 beta-barrel fold-containing protein [Clostridia bacterium]
MTINEIKNIISSEIININESYNNSFLLIEDIYRCLLNENVFGGDPLTPVELRALLRKKIVDFEFVKLDGEDRLATGTLRMDLIPKKDHPKGIKPSDPSKTITYYDLDKKAWRSVSTKSKEISLVQYGDDEERSEVKIIDDTDKDSVKINDNPDKDTIKIEKPAEPIEEPVKIEPIEEPIEPTEPIEEPVEPTEPIEEPVEPAEPIEEPVEPIEEPTEPIEEPVEPAEPIEEPVEPIEEPIEPIEPNNDKYDNTSKGASIHKLNTGGNSVKINKIINNKRKKTNIQNNYAKVSDNGKVKVVNPIQNKNIYNINGRNIIKIPGILNIKNKNI